MLAPSFQQAHRALSCQTCHSAEAGLNEEDLGPHGAQGVPVALEVHVQPSVQGLAQNRCDQEDARPQRLLDAAIPVIQVEGTCVKRRISDSDQSNDTAVHQEDFPDIITEGLVASHQGAQSEATYTHEQSLEVTQGLGHVC